MKLTGEERKEILARVATLRGMNMKIQKIAETLNDEGFTLGNGTPIKKQNVSGYLHTLKKQGNGQLGVSRAEALFSRNATIEAQIEKLRAEQNAGVSDLPRMIFEKEKKHGGAVQFDMTPEGGIHVSCSGSFEFDYTEAKKLTDWIKGNF